MNRISFVCGLSLLLAPGSSAGEAGAQSADPFVRRVPIGEWPYKVNVVTRTEPPGFRTWHAALARFKNAKNVDYLWVSRPWTKTEEEQTRERATKMKRMADGALRAMTYTMRNDPQPVRALELVRKAVGDDRAFVLGMGHLANRTRPTAYDTPITLTMTAGIAVKDVLVLGEDLTADSITRFRDTYRTANWMSDAERARWQRVDQLLQTCHRRFPIRR